MMEGVKECRYQMRFWLEASKDARMRGDEINEQHAIQMFRWHRDDLLTIWSSSVESAAQCG
ncbi:hypothetical protein NSS64_32410 [Paenibacillus sp. FSL H8-0122]|uniref:hypothetical protein n=1 Tax=Paenibacillus sp. FSL H8-0122 TaxID=2954510 RepID=UPI0030F9A605